jgi:hypothetical protein
MDFPWLADTFIDEKIHQLRPKISQATAFIAAQLLPGASA